MKIVRPYQKNGISNLLPNKSCVWCKKYNIKGKTYIVWLVVFWSFWMHMYNVILK